MKTSEAYVFDIKRFAVHDGQGIRTTVFFKGCPLRCMWCQNPEGLLPDPQILYLENECIHCGLCQKHAFKGQLIAYEDRPYFNKQYPGRFDNLINICPSTAIRYDATRYSVDELLEKVKEDQIFFQQAGGVTVSGGEPLMQGEFLVTFLRRCQEEGIHTMMETSAYGSWEILSQALHFLDALYVDLKIYDDKAHQKATGVSNQLILRHIENILSGPFRHKVIIRTPLIPGFTASPENIAAIVRFITRIDPDVRYELLNYNPLAEAKYHLTDFTYGVTGHPKMYTSTEMQVFYETARQAGLKHLIIE